MKTLRFIAIAGLGCFIVLSVIVIVSMVSPSNNDGEKRYTTKEMCEKETHATCLYRECSFRYDAIRIDEVCGKGFSKGWAPNE